MAGYKLSVMENTGFDTADMTVNVIIYPMKLLITFLTPISWASKSLTLPF